MIINKRIQAAVMAFLLTASSVTLAAELSASDASFLKKATQSGLFEVSGGNLALKKSKNTEVQKFAKMMVEDHGKSVQKLKALAQKKNVELPSEPNFMQKGSLMLLGTYSTKSFDQSYSENIGVEAHEKTVELFEEAIKTSADADIKQYATEGLPKVKHHLEMAKKLDEMID